MSETEPDKSGAIMHELASPNIGQNGTELIEVGDIAEYIAEMLDPLSRLAGDTGMELLSMLIDFAAREAHNIKDVEDRPCQE